MSEPEVVQSRQLEDHNEDFVCVLNDSSPPPELTLTGFLQFSHPNLPSPVATTFTIDTAAGHSYLLVNNHDVIHCAQSVLEPPLVVYFADGSRQHIHSSFIVSLTLNCDSAIRYHQVRIYPLVSNQPVSTPREVIFGRDLIKRLRVVIQGTSHITINGVLSTPPRSSDHVRRLLDPIPQALIDDLTAMVESDDDTVFTDQPRERNPTPDSAQLNITFIPDNQAPRGRPTLDIPWISDQRPDSNYRITRARDRAQCSKLSETESQLYGEAIETLLQGGFAELLAESRISPTHFISIRPVFRLERNSTKCRLCLDARVINSYTRTGPIPDVTILHCLLRFRSSPFVSIFDLCKAFWQIAYSPSALGWFSTIIDQRPLTFTRMIFGSNFSPSALHQALTHIIKLGQDHILSSSPLLTDEPTRPRTVSAVFYVDDFHTSSDTPEEEQVQCRWLRWWLQQFGFPSDKHFSNCTTNDKDTWTKYLSYHWHPSSDTLHLREHPRRSIPDVISVKDLVAITSSFYDPLGIALGIQLSGRQLVRLAFQDGRTWDSTIPTPLRNRLMEWTQNWQLTWSGPRFVKYRTLYVFADASESFWAYEVYSEDLLLIYSRGGLNGKGSIPRFELAALTHAVTDLVKWPLQELGCQRLHFYSDSLCNIQRLQRLRHIRKLGQYEKTRVVKIQLTEFPTAIPWDIRYIWGSHNPADYNTRPCSSPRPDIQREILLPLLHHEKFPRWSCHEIHTDDFALIDEDAFTEDLVMKMTLRSSRNSFNPSTTTTVPTTTLTLSPEDNQHSDHLADNLSVNADEDNAAPPLEPLPTPNSSAIHHQTTLLVSQLRYLTELRDLVSTTSDRRTRHFQIDSKTNLLTYKGLFVIPRYDSQLIHTILHRIHDHTHRGISATTHAIERHGYFLKGSRQVVKQFIHHCETCQRARAVRHVRTTVGNQYWLAGGALSTIRCGEIVGIDITPIDSSADFTCCLVITCAVTKYIRARPLRTQLSHEIISALQDCFMDSFFPKLVLSDNASSFRSRKFQIFCLRTGINHVTLPAYAESYHGWYERSNSGIQQVLRVLSTKKAKPWFEHLKSAIHILNSQPYQLNDPTGLCPLHMAFCGYSPPLTDLEQYHAHEELLKLAHLAHLSRPNIALIQETQDRCELRRKQNIRLYESIWRNKRDETRSKLQHLSTQPPQQFTIGSQVRVYRPNLSKAHPPWSEPRVITAIPSAATRTVRKTDGSSSLEYLVNLQLIPPASPGVFQHLEEQATE